jgi:hypothetical protein
VHLIADTPGETKVARWTLRSLILYVASSQMRLLTLENMLNIEGTHKEEVAYSRKKAKV